MSDKAAVYTQTDTFDCPVVGPVVVRKLVRAEVVRIGMAELALVEATTPDEKRKAREAKAKLDCDLILACVSEWPKGPPNPAQLPQDAFDALLVKLNEFSGLVEKDPETEEQEQEQVENLPETPSV